MGTTAEVVQDIAAMVNARRWQDLDALYAEDVVLHAGVRNRPSFGREAARTLYEDLAIAVPDLRYDVVDTIIEGDRAAVHGQLAGTQSGPLGGFDPSGRTFAAVDDARWYRIQDGRVTEEWLIPATGRILEKVGQVPSGPPPKPLMFLLGLKARMAPTPPTSPRDLTPVEVPDAGQARFGGVAPEKKAVIQRGMTTLFNGRRWDLAEEVYHPDYHLASNMDTTSGRDAVIAFYQKVTSSLPDMFFTLDDMIAEGDRVGVLCTVRATHLGPLEGFPPTGNRLEASEIFFYTVTEGKAKATYHQVNVDSMLTQLGLAPEGRPPLPLRMLLKLANRQAA